MRGFVSVAIGLASGIFAFVAAAGLTASLALPIPIAILTAALAGFASWRFIAVDAAAAPRALRIVSGLATIVALAATARLAVFMVDATQVSCSALPTSRWETRHSCVSAYFIAGQRAGDVANIYDETLYSVPDSKGGEPRPRSIGPFAVDRYEYPPPFLLLPRALERIPGLDFMRFRAVWFGLGGAFVLFAMLLVARALAPAAATRALLLVPLAWAAMPMLSTLQKGNFQPMAFALAMLAMVLFARGRHAAGGALLAFATVSKMFPGMLVVYLLARREWRAVIWTVAMTGALFVLTVVDMGWAPFQAFVGQVQALLSGEAFSAFRHPASIAINHSVPGMIFKLKVLGIANLSFPAMRIVGWLYTLVVAAATVLAARRPPRETHAPLLWLAILSLAAHRSPFLPQTWAVLPSLWLVTLLAATSAPTLKALGLTLLAWATLNVFVPVDSPVSPRWSALITAVPQLVSLALATLVVTRAASPASSLPPG